MTPKRSHKRRTPQTPYTPPTIAHCISTAIAVCSRLYPPRYTNEDGTPASPITLRKFSWE